jgi:hypothetical protein
MANKRRQVKPSYEAVTEMVTWANPRVIQAAPAPE